LFFIESQQIFAGFLNLKYLSALNVQIITFVSEKNNYEENSFINHLTVYVQRGLFARKT
jgi:hypothetical protein